MDWHYMRLRSGVKDALLIPNPPISGERLEFWRRQGEICGEKASFHGVRSAITVRGEARRSPQFVHCEKGRHSAPSFKKVVCQSADKHDILVQVGSSDHGQQPQALPVGGRPLAHGGHSQDESSGMVKQSPGYVEEQEAQAL